MLIPFINFGGQAAEAIALYEMVFEVTDKQVFFFRDMPEEMKSHFPPETMGYVMHSEMKINGSAVWIGDSVQGTTPGDRVTISVPYATVEEVRTTFDKLMAAGGEALMEPEQTFYSPLFGTVRDRFGVIWHLICQP